MRRITAVSVCAVTVVALSVVGCGSSSSSPDGMTADLERDLQLASAVRSERSGVTSALEQGPTGSPSGSARGERNIVTVKKRSPSPTRSGALRDVAAAKTPSDMPAPTFAVGVTQSSAPVDIPEPVVTAPTHGPSITVSTGAESGGWDEGTAGRGRGDEDRGRGRAGTGVIIRGGGAGDDHCEPRGPRGRAPGGQVGGIGGGGGMIGGIIGGIGRIPTRANFPRR